MKRTTKIFFIVFFLIPLALIFIVNLMHSNQYFIVVIIITTPVAIIIGRRYYRQYQRKLQDEADKKWKEKINAFIKSDEYRYIKQYAKKYNEGDIDEHSLYKIQDLIGNKWDFMISHLKEFIKREREIQNNLSVKNRLLATNPKTIDEYLQHFLDICGEEYEYYLPVILELLREKNYDFEPNNLMLQIKETKRKNDLKHYENNLFEEESITIEDIDFLAGYDFERLLKKVYEKMGYNVIHTPLAGDQGADLIIEKFGEKIVIQAKRESSKISNKAVQEAAAAKKYYNAQKGMVITNNYFTKSAEDLAKANGIILINRDALKNLIAGNY